MTSSLRNSIHRRNHRERSQLGYRSKLGILEKHADYVQRARDYHSKQDKLTRLKQKAAERNNDEFYFSMKREKTRGGIHLQERGNTSLHVDVVKVLKTQDENYVRTMRAVGLKKIDKIKSQLMALADLVKLGSFDHRDDEEGINDDEINILREFGKVSRSLKGKGKRRREPQHILFVDSDEQARDYAHKFQTTPTDRKEDSNTKANMQVSDLGWKIPDEKKESTKRKVNISETNINGKSETAEEWREQSSVNRSRLLNELSARLTRDKQLRYAQREFEMQRLMMGKGARQKLVRVEKAEGVEGSDEDEEELDSRKGRGKGRRKIMNEKTYKPRVYKWRLERKR